VIVSLLYQLTRRLLCVPTVLLRRDVTKDAELLVLRHENAVLRRQITGQVRYEPADRFWFTALSSLLPRRRWHEIFPVQPATILTWHCRFIAAKWDYSARRRLRRCDTTARRSRSESGWASPSVMSSASRGQAESLAPARKHRPGHRDATTCTPQWTKLYIRLRCEVGNHLEVTRPHKPRRARISR
jgi:hypothetical protein